MKNKLTRKLMLSAFTLLFAVISLGASTYAWFTMNTTATVDVFEGQVIGGSGFDIAVTTKGYKTAENNEFDKITWYSGVLPSSAIMTVIENSSFEQFDACTPAISADAKKISDNQLFKTQEEALKKATTSSSNGYIVFDLHFKLSDDQNTGSWQINFDAFELSVDESTQNDWTCDVEYNVANGYTDKKVTAGTTNIKYDVSNAARIAIVAAKEGDYNGYSEVFEKAQDGTTKYGNSKGFQTEGALEYYNAKANAGTDVKDELPTVQYSASDTAISTNLPVLTGGKIVTLTVYVWIEGWDGECMNPIFSQKLNTKLNFSISVATSDSEPEGQN